MSRLVIVLAMVLATAGCASLSSSPGAASEVDAAYVAYVENAAKRFGTTVIWVNYPQRRVDPAAAAPAAK